MIWGIEIKENTKLKILVFSLLLTGSVLVGITGGVLYAITRDLPQIRALENFQPSAITRIYSADKVLLHELFVEKRDPVPLSAMPQNLKSAILATEDRTFYQHSGINPKGILRAIIRDIWAGEFVEGASTITQQLTKTLFLSPQKKLVRKIKEAFLAFQLERRYTKDEILEFYMNQIYLGSGAYGVSSAAKIFFGKEVADLTLAECALVAGMPKAPSRYSPYVDRDLALKRRATVLGQMKQIGVIPDTAYSQAMAEPLSLKRPERAMRAPYFVAYTKTILEKQFGSSLLYKGGFTISTTLSYALQLAAERSAQRWLPALEKRMARNNITHPDPQYAIISLDVHSGGILAMVGGKDYLESPFNRATQAKRQPGSAFKPIIYGLAIEKGFPQNKVLLDAPVAFRQAGNQEDWKPENYSKHFQGEMTMRHALVLSKNVPAVRLLEMLGPSAAVSFGYRLGIQTPLLPNLSLALGTSEVTLIDLATAYGVFANGGKRVAPNSVVAVIDGRGQQLWHVKPQQELVVSADVAAIVTNMLEGVITEGTGRKARVLGRPVAGKTGTTNDFRDALFVGYSPSITTGVWVGQDRFHTLGKGETGARAALPIWIDIMSAALKSTPYEVFELPADVVQIPMDPLTGHRTQADAPNAAMALFRKGTEPR
ncbi:MAG: PBP1A family penicillin-binding protein [Desulfobacterales bacterium]